jgi:hypothetical protein
MAAAYSYLHTIAQRVGLRVQELPPALVNRVAAFVQRHPQSVLASPFISGYGQSHANVFHLDHIVSDDATMVGTPLEISLTIDVAFGTFQSTANISIELDNLDIDLALDMMLDSWGLTNLTLLQLSNPYCLLAQASLFNLSRFNLTFDGFDIVVSTGPPGATPVIMYINGTNITNFINYGIQSGIPGIFASWNSSISTSMYAAPYECSCQPVPIIPTPSPSSKAVTWQVMVAIVSVSSMGILGVCVYLVDCFFLSMLC